ncbi:MAG: bifunctional diaminohydroxyphosphoribosylaminopyrimidine deaminase/5-amino-6-(5-phosphoribosylamino)uracil reductase RibD [Chloroflexota bacterium]|nr:bifunctional diaminohydroxyphosphoribosylaminopyrimidine deaminase/5-amino-6-(5-phosphoribosylamino)uracil reductase RibD [Chloroflexota bacterium]
MNDEHYMKKALALARRGLGKTSPNPMVGALFVKDDEIIGQGYHRRFGGHHAEIDAIEHTRGDINGSTLYVTLEPCCHHGKKTPPCLDALLKYNLARVVIGTIDPNPQVNGKSIEALREHGIETKVGVLSERCNELNEVYFKYIQTRMPFITLKFAQTLDGRIATTTGDSRWISSEPSLKLAHQLRSFHDAVLVGINTVLTDNPQLTVRLVDGRNPLRIVIDSKLRIPLNSRILQDQETAPTVIATTSRNSEKSSSLRQIGIEVLDVAEDREGRVDLVELFQKLGKRNISSVLVEGGATVITSLIRQGLADKLLVILSPKITGKGIDTIGDLEILDIGRALRFSFVRTYRSGEDLVIEARYAR